MPDCNLFHQPIEVIYDGADRGQLALRDAPVVEPHVGVRVIVLELRGLHG